MTDRSPSAPPSPRFAVLVEGPSDAVVLEVLAAARGIRFARLEAAGALDAALIAMGGVTNTRRELLRLRALHPGIRVLGLCDAPEARFVAGALHEAGGAVTGTDELEAAGFFVCEADLEDELIRALGAEEVRDAVVALGEGAGFDRFRRQPWWRDRPLADQLHRFAGSGAGRKLALARELAHRLGPTTTPRPLAGLLDRVEAAG